MLPLCAVLPGKGFARVPNRLLPLGGAELPGWIPRPCVPIRDLGSPQTLRFPMRSRDSSRRQVAAQTAIQLGAPPRPIPSPGPLRGLSDNLATPQSDSEGVNPTLHHPGHNYVAPHAASAQLQCARWVPVAGIVILSARTNTGFDQDLLQK